MGIQARKFIINQIYDCIKDRRQHRQAARNDLLTKLVAEGLFSDEIIADFILFLLFAGYETSSTAMAFAVKFLTENPLALEQLRVPTVQSIFPMLKVVVKLSAKIDFKLDISYTFVWR